MNISSAMSINQNEQKYILIFQEKLTQTKTSILHIRRLLLVQILSQNLIIKGIFELALNMSEQVYIIEINIRWDALIGDKNIKLQN